MICTTYLMFFVFLFPAQFHFYLSLTQPFPSTPTLPSYTMQIYGKKDKLFRNLPNKSFAKIKIDRMKYFPWNKTFEANKNSPAQFLQFGIKFLEKIKKSKKIKACRLTLRKKLPEKLNINFVWPYDDSFTFCFASVYVCLFLAILPTYTISFLTYNR